MPALSMWGPGRPSLVGRGTIPLVSRTGVWGVLMISHCTTPHMRGAVTLPPTRGGSTNLRSVWGGCAAGAVRVCVSRRFVDGALEGVREGEIVRLFADRYDAWEALQRGPAES